MGATGTLTPNTLSKAEAWDRTIERIIRGIVSIKAASVRGFDTESPGDYTATGFVVDKKRGIVLSNRHVVSPAPITARGVFVNYEEVPLIPIYRDPVHDFGFFKYDPTKVKFLDVEEIELHPELARVGLSIKVVGNDSGEKLSILGSTLARLDRTAPRYGDGVYEDFNTFYYQAATGTSGGSSGSPVLNISGHAIALNAGGSRRSASSFYLPLDRAVRALRCLQDGVPITRGTLQTEFVHRPYDELRRLGLPPDVEVRCRLRNEAATGVLTVFKVLPDGPGHNVLEPGDILLSCNGEPIDAFVPLWEIVDSSVDQEITLEIYRNSVPLTVRAIVQDLYAITPDRFAEIGGAVFHDLSYQHARSFGMSLKNPGTFVASSGMLNWSSLARNFLVTTMANKPTPNLDAFLEVMSKIPDGALVPSRHKDLGQVRETTGLVEIDRHFHLDHLYVRNDAVGSWDRYDLPAPPPAPPRRLPESRCQSAVEEELEDLDLDADTNPSIEQIKRCMVDVTTRLPFSINGYTSSKPYYGVGTILSLDSPLGPIIVTDRAAVPAEMVDIQLTIQYHLVSGTILCLDKMAFITFDRSQLPADVVLTVPPLMAAPTAGLRLKDEVVLIGMDASQTLRDKKTTVSALGDVGTTKCNPPRFRLTNVEATSVQDSIPLDGGVLARRVEEPKAANGADGANGTAHNGSGTANGTSGTPSGPASASAKADKPRYEVIGLWINASAQDANGNDTFWKTGIDFGVYVRPVLDALVNQRPLPVERTFNIELANVPMSVAAGLGLSQARIREFLRLAKKRTNAATFRPLSVFDKFAGASNGTDEDKDQLQVGDILLSLDGEALVRFFDIERHLQATPDQTTYEFLVLRDGEERRVRVAPERSLPTYTSRVVQWNGAFLHSSYAAAAEQVSREKTALAKVPRQRGVYVGSVSFGAPALSSIRPAQWLLEVDGQPVDSLDSLIALIGEHRWPDGEFVRVKQVSRTGVTSVVSVQIDELFWPTRYLARGGAGEPRWRRSWRRGSTSRAARRA
ncbi:uncharacterized protein V1510DRAFT_425991 [Dipodascopsis tothii]|uniref:uncharacterized protein n=1 Tax=Dipodascopsis tothii TaxID=44089 RepID=UPI0034CDB7C2